MLLALKKVVRAAERRFYERLHDIRQERGNPVNYRSLELTSTALRYVDLLNRVHVVPFEDIVEVEFVREEAMFPCLDGPYLETKWMIGLTRNTRVEVMDEAPHRKKLIAAFSSRLLGFNISAASLGLRSNEAGKWVCYSSSNPHSSEA